MSNQAAILSCPHCNCNATTCVSVRTRELRRKRGDAWEDVSEVIERHRCSHCGCRFTQTREVAMEPDPSEPVVYGRTRCPHCRSADNTVSSTQGNVRYHRCGACGQTFKSVDE